MLIYFTPNKEAQKLTQNKTLILWLDRLAQPPHSPRQTHAKSKYGKGMERNYHLKDKWRFQEKFAQDYIGPPGMGLSRTDLSTTGLLWPLPVEHFSRYSRQSCKNYGRPSAFCTLLHLCSTKTKGQFVNWDLYSMVSPGFFRLFQNALDLLCTVSVGDGFSFMVSSGFVVFNCFHFAALCFKLRCLHWRP